MGYPQPTNQEQQAANQLRSIIAASSENGRTAKFTLTDERGGKADIVLAPGISQTLLDLLRLIGKGEAVTLLGVSQQLTTQEAADILNVSRPHLIKLLERGEIPFELVGRHRRIRAKDLLGYKSKRDNRRSEALAEMAREDAELI